MIELITGAPGTGKTSLVVSEMLKVKDRPFFVMGIPELKVPHEMVPPISEWTRLVPTPEDESILEPQFTFPPNAIIIIDEAQKVYRPRSSASKVPDHVAAFETHRHCGIDFWLLTQSPGLLDANIRRLTARHRHVHAAPLGRKLLEWSQCRDPESKTDRGDAIRIDYKPDKKVFSLYKSAEAHTVIKRRISKSVVLAAVCATLLPIALYYGYTRISSRLNPPKPEADQVQKIGIANAAPATGPAARPASGPASMPASDVLHRFDPVHPNFPESAPAYDQLRVVKSMPVVAGCIKTAQWCRCYSQQATKLDIQPDRCADIIANKVFDPYREPVMVTPPRPTEKPASAPQKPALALAGN